MTQDQDREAERIRIEYARRDAEMPPSDWRTNIYHPRHPVGHFFAQNNRSALVRALNALEVDLSRERVLDVGCGAGAWLRVFVDLGSEPSALTGIDLSESRIATACSANPAIGWVHYGGGPLPFGDGTFTLVMQAVVFSSILDEEMRVDLAQEMLRVTTDSGRLMWIDLKSPVPGRLEGFSEERIVGYFPGCAVAYRDDMHPGYARKLTEPAAGGGDAWAQLRYALTRHGCESTLLVLQKGAS